MSYATFADELQTELEKETKRPFGRASVEVLAKLYYPVAGANEPQVLGVQEARAVFEGWESAGLVDNLGRVTDAMREAVATGAVPLPEALIPEARIAVKALAERLVTRLTHNTETKVRVERKEETIASDAFRALWAKVSAKTRYRLSFTDDDLIAKAVEFLQRMPDPATARVTWASAELIIARDGVETGKARIGHGFRAMASTLLNESGKWSADAIEPALAHKDKDAVRAAYHRGQHWQERVDMAQWWADFLDQLRKGAEVVILHQRNQR